MIDNLRSPPHYLRCLRTELANRKKRNPRYSLRSFARAIDIDPSALSRVLRGIHKISPSCCVKVLRNLKLAAPDRQKFIDSVVQEWHQQITSSLSQWDAGAAELDHLDSSSVASSTGPSDELVAAV